MKNFVQNIASMLQRADDYCDTALNPRVLLEVAQELAAEDRPQYRSMVREGSMEG